MVDRWTALFVWAFASWLILTWSTQTQQLVTGAVVAVLAATAQAPLAPVARPWLVLSPRRVGPAVALLAVAAGKILIANIGLARRIWSPRRPLRSGMVIVPTRLRSEGGVGMLGVITSLVVDNQIVDVDNENALLQYHAVSVRADPAENTKAILEPVQRIIDVISRGPR